MNPDQFAETIKAKYPQYQNVDNATLTQKIIAKYPQYASKVQMPQQDQALGNPSFQASQTDTPLQAGLKALENIPSSAINFGKSTIESLNPINTAKTISEIATPSKNGVHVSVGDVLKELPAAAYHTLVPQFLQHLIGGDTSKAQADVTNDPVGQIAPFLLAAEGGAKLLDRFNTAPEAGTAVKTLDSGISDIAQKVISPISSTFGKVGDFTGGIAKSAASHITGLDTSTIQNIIDNPEAFSKIAQDNLDRGGLAGEVKTAIDQRIQDLSSTGKGYENIRNTPLGDTPISTDLTAQSPAPTGAVQIPYNTVSDVFKKHGIELVDGKVKVGPESIPLSPADVSSLQHFVDTYGNETQLSNNAFLNTRGALSNLSKYDAGKTANIKTVARDLRSTYDTLGKSQIPGLKELDAAYEPEIKFLKQIKKDYINTDGTFKDGAVNKIANSTGVGKENLLSRLENVMPGITKRVQVLKAVEDIERAKGIKIGNYGRIAVGGAGYAAGGITGALIAEIITSPTFAVPLIKGLGYTNAQLIPILSKLKALAGDPNAAALFAPGAFQQSIDANKTETENNPVINSVQSPLVGTPPQKEPATNK